MYRAHRWWRTPLPVFSLKITRDSLFLILTITCSLRVWLLKHFLFFFLFNGRQVCCLRRFNWRFLSWNGRINWIRRFVSVYFEVKVDFQFAAICGGKCHSVLRRLKWSFEGDTEVAWQQNWKKWEKIFFVKFTKFVVCSSHGGSTCVWNWVAISCKLQLQFFLYCVCWPWNEILDLRNLILIKS